jgi:DnaK suppressor protein
MTPILSAEQRQLLEASLRQRQAELDRQVAEHQQGGTRVEHARDLLEQDGDDAPQRDADREIDLARTDRELYEAGLVSQALKRLATPLYGRCQQCNEPIAFERLKLEPWALRCVACESQREGKSAGHHSL